MLSDEEKEVLKKLDQHTEFLPASFVEELLMELKNYSSSWTKNKLKIIGIINTKETKILNFFNISISSNGKQFFFYF